jgi:3D (Asp-Asp-Asp) domain-containing protein
MIYLKKKQKEKEMDNDFIIGILFAFALVLLGCCEGIVDHIFYKEPIPEPDPIPMISIPYNSPERIEMGQASRHKEPIEIIEQERELLIFEATAYTLEDGSGTGKTATGTIPEVGRTIAVDPKVIPYGSKVIVNGHTYIAEDTGGAIKGNRLDIYMGSGNDAYMKAKQFGRQNVEVIIEKE